MYAINQLMKHFKQLKKTKLSTIDVLLLLLILLFELLFIEIFYSRNLLIEIQVLINFFV